MGSEGGGGRPGTATLERPSFLDPAFTHVDMTKLTAGDVDRLLGRGRPPHGDVAPKRGRPLQRAGLPGRSEPLADGVPAPCLACGRPDQPERLHSHPAPRRRPEPSKPVRSSVTKPLAIKYRSGRRNELSVVKPCHNLPVPAPVVALPSPKLVRSPLRTPKKNIPRVPDRTTTNSESEIYCYICGKTFNDKPAELKVHEKDCYEKWSRPKRIIPDVPLNFETYKPEANGLSEVFWQQHLTQLVACSKCSRKFNPDRVKVHEKSCKGQINITKEL